MAGAQATRAGATLVVEQVTKTFGQKAAVDRASFRVEGAAMIGIIGRSGAGTSTFLRMMTRLTDASAGRILFRGRDILQLTGGAKRAWQSDCAMIFQQFNLVPRMDVCSNVLHGTLNRRPTLSSMFNLYPTDDIHRAIGIFDRLGMARRYCDRVIGMRDGRIVFDGTPEQLTTGVPRDIYGAGADFSDESTSTEIGAIGRATGTARSRALRDAKAAVF